MLGSVLKQNSNSKASIFQAEGLFDWILKMTLVFKNILLHTECLP